MRKVFLILIGLLAALQVTVLNGQVSDQQQKACESITNAAEREACLNVLKAQASCDALKTKEEQDDCYAKALGFTSEKEFEAEMDEGEGQDKE